MATYTTYTYEVGGPLSLDSLCYIERKADKDLLESLMKGEYSNILCPRQTGKSSLQIRTMSKLNAMGYSCAILDMTSIVSREIREEQFYASIIKVLADNFQLNFDLNVWWEKNKLISSLQKLNKFIEGILLRNLTGPLVVFIEEVDSVLSLKFPFDDFFAFIRACHNIRSYKKEYNRITFSVFGVANPSDLISDKDRTPFNIGKQFELNGFTYQEALPLTTGLKESFADPQQILKKVLYYSGGQPFLTQKILKLLADSSAKIKKKNKENLVGNLVENSIVTAWEINDNPEHLRTIRDRILRNQSNASRLLSLYKDVLSNKTVNVNNNIDQIELLLSGIVKKSKGKLSVTNKIYKKIFNKKWVLATLDQLRPYAKQMKAWYVSNCKDDSRLITGLALKEALEWSKQKEIGNQDYRYLSESQNFDKKIAINEADRISSIKAQELLNDVTIFLNKIDPKLYVNKFTRKTIWKEIINIFAKIIERYQFNSSFCYLSDSNDLSTLRNIAHYPEGINIPEEIVLLSDNHLSKFLNNKDGIEISFKNSDIKLIDNQLPSVFTSSSVYLYANEIIPHNIVLIGFEIKQNGHLIKLEKTILDISVERIINYIRNSIFQTEQQSLMAMYGHQISRDISLIESGITYMERYGYSDKDVSDPKIAEIIKASKLSIKRGLAKLRLISLNYGDIVASQAFLEGTEMINSRKSETVDIIRVIKNIIEFYKPFLLKEAKVIRVEGPLTECKVSTLEEPLQLIFWNIIDNAIKFAYKNTTITVNISDKINTYVIKVSNLGIGLAKDENLKVFNQYYRSRLTKLHAPPGQGLGLFTVSRQMHFLFPKGSLTINSHASSKTDEGRFEGDRYITTVKITIPKG